MIGEKTPVPVNKAWTRIATGVSCLTLVTLTLTLTLGASSVHAQTAASGTAACIPVQLLPTEFGNRKKDLGVISSSVRSDYLEGLENLYCDGQEDEGWAKIARSALAGYRPGIRFLALQISKTPELLYGREDRLYERFLAEARLGSTSAINAVAYMHERGFHVPLDLAKAQEWYGLGAARGSQRAIEKLAIGTALGYGQGPDDEAAMRLLFDLAPARMSRAVTEILIGLAKRDEGERVAGWYDRFHLRLGEQLDLRIRSDFGEALENSTQVQDQEHLKKYAAALGVPDAKYDYALALLQDRSEEAEPEIVQHLFDAAASGSMPGARLLAQLATDPHYGPDTQRDARLALRRSASQGSGAAKLVEADMFYFAETGSPILPFAAHSLNGAAREDMPIAKMRYGIVLALGLGVPQDLGQARDVLKEAAQQGNALSQTILSAIGEAVGPVQAEVVHKPSGLLPPERGELDGIQIEE